MAKMAIFSNLLFRKSPALISRGFHATSSLQASEMSRVYFYSCSFYKFGLFVDDLANEYNPDVAEALRRLPEDVVMQRKYRAIRASQAEINNSFLPKDQWTKYEDNHYYLQPYLSEVVAERLEREEWEATH